MSLFPILRITQNLILYPTQDIDLRGINKLAMYFTTTFAIQIRNKLFIKKEIILIDAERSYKMKQLAALGEFWRNCGIFEKLLMH